MPYYILILILFGWHILGFIVAGTCASCSSDGALSRAEGFEFVNPCFIYEHNYVNWFGAIVVCVVYSLLIPIGTICYWFYKLCTVGRK